MDVNVQIPKEHILAMVLLMFLIGGLVIGYVIGNYVMYKRWDEYNSLWQEKVQKECICKEENKSNILRWNYGFNETYI